MRVKFVSIYQVAALAITESGYLNTTNTGKVVKSR